ncbi:MAG: hypothetical protein AB7S75_05425 [Desulfococcaceae bacterium]
MRKFQSIFAVNHRAFMLIELIIVMLMMSFLSIVILTRNPAGYVTLAGESETIRCRLRYVRNLALADDRDSWGLEITDDPGYQLVHKAIGPMPLPGGESLTALLPSGYTIDITRDDGANPDEIFFDRWGAPADGMDYFIIISETATGISETIRIVKHTGFIQ